MRISTRRIDTAGRRLRYQVFFPADWDLPFVMTHFSIDPRPADLTHPCGARRIAAVHFPAPEGKHALIRRLCPDEALILAPLGTPMRIAFDNGTTLPEPAEDE